MKFDVIYNYVFSFVPKGHQNHQQAVERAATTISIKDIESSEAPVVLKVANPNSKERPHESYNRFLAKENGDPREIRYFDGKFYVESIDSENFISTSCRPESLEKSFLTDYENGRDTRVHYHNISPIAGTSKTYPARIQSLRSVRLDKKGLRDHLTEDDEGREVAEKMQEQADKMFVCNGITFEECREPVFVYDKRGRYGIIEAPTEVKKIIPSEYSYILEDFDYHFTSGLEHARSVMKDAKVNPDSLHYEIINSNPLSYDGVSRDVIEHLNHGMRELKQVLLFAPTSFARAYFSLQKELSEIDDHTPTISRGMLDAANEVVNAGVNPDISDRMVEINKHREFRCASDEDEIIKVGLDYNYDKTHQIDTYYIDKSTKANEKFLKAQSYINKALERWNERAYGAIFNSDLPVQSVTIHNDKQTVTEINSMANAKYLASQSTIPVEEIISEAYEGSARIFRIGQCEIKSEGPAQSITGLLNEGFIVAPDGSNDASSWKYFPSKNHNEHLSEQAAKELVSKHINTVLTKEELLSEDDEEISIIGFESA